MNPIAKTVDYLRSSRAELEKVTWPSRQDVIRYTSLVIGVSIVLAAAFAALDFGLNRGVTYLVAHRAGGSTARAAAPAAAPVTPDIQPVDVQTSPVTNIPVPSTK